MRRFVSVFIALLLMVSLFSACANPLKMLNADELMSLGEKYLLELKYEQAVAAFTRLIEIEPKNPRGYTGLSEAYAGQGDEGKAEETLLSAIEIEGAELWVYLALAGLYAQSDDERAAETWEKVLEVQPDNEDAIRYLSEWNASRFDTDALLALLRKMLYDKIVNDQPISDPAALPIEAVNWFIVSYANAARHLNPPGLYADAIKDGKLSFRQYKTIAYEVFGIEDAAYIDFGTGDGSWFDSAEQAYVYPGYDELTSSFYEYANEDVSVRPDGAITVSIDLILRTEVGMYRQFQARDLGRYEVRFQIMEEGGHSFIRFIGSERVYTNDPRAVHADASSTLAESVDYSYFPGNMLDGSIETAWAEGAGGYGVGETLQLPLEISSSLTGFTIQNGYWRTPETLQNNGRIKKMRVHFDDGISEDFTLRDPAAQDYSQLIAGSGEQIFFAEEHITGFVTLEILEVYEGSRWQDTCVTGITLQGKAGEGYCGPTNAVTGQDGRSLHWSLDFETGLLRIAGIDSMDDFGSVNASWAPWFGTGFAHNGGYPIKRVEIEDGVASIGTFAFHNCRNLTDLTIPASITRIGEYVFFIGDGFSPNHSDKLDVMIHCPEGSYAHRYAQENGLAYVS